MGRGQVKGAVVGSQFRVWGSGFAVVLILVLVGNVLFAGAGRMGRILEAIMGSLFPLQTQAHDGRLVRMGRIFYVIALAIIAGTQVRSVIHAIHEGGGEMGKEGFRLALLGLILVYAYRGGTLSVVLLKGCAGMMGLVLLLVVVGVSAALPAWFFDGSGSVAGKLSDSWRSLTAKPLEMIVFLLTTGYVVWAMFFSKAVRAFIAFQRAGPYLDLDEAGN